MEVLRTHFLEFLVSWPRVRRPFVYGLFYINEPGICQLLLVELRTV